MPQQIHLDADLELSVELPGDRTVTGQLTGSGRALTLEVDTPNAFTSRSDSAVIRLLAQALAQAGLTVTVVAPSGPLVTLGAPRPPWWQRRVTGSRHIRIERGAALWSLARGRARATAGVLPSGHLSPPGTVWPVLPTLGRRRRVVTTTTHARPGAGRPRLVVAPGSHPGPADAREVFELDAEVTTIGSDSGCDIRLVDVEPWAAEIRHDERDEFILVRLGQPGSTLVNGTPVDTALLRTASRVQLGPVTLSFYREEYADHGRPYGGRLGGELGQNTPQPSRPAPRSHHGGDT